MAIHRHIPLEDFFRPPTRTEASISPDGTRIAYLVPWRNRLNVWVAPVDLRDGIGSEARCVDQIRTPLLVVQGANDVRVVQAESDNLVEALRARGVDVEYMVKDDEGHGFINSNNVIDMYRLVDQFLGEHLAVEQKARTA